MTIEKKKIFNCIKNKKVQNEKFLKVSDFIEYLTDCYMCLQLDFNMLEEELENIKEQTMIMIYKIIVKT